MSVFIVAPPTEGLQVQREVAAAIYQVHVWGEVFLQLETCQ